MPLIWHRGTRIDPPSGKYASEDKSASALDREANDILGHEQRIEEAVSAPTIEVRPLDPALLVVDGGRRRLRSFAVTLQKQIMPAHDRARQWMFAQAF